MAARFDRDQVDVELRSRLRGVLERLGVGGRAVGDEWRTRLCPTCGPRTRDAVAINTVTGRWIDHAHGCAGDVFDLIAGVLGLDVRRDFAVVLERAAELVGIAPNDRVPDQAQRDEHDGRAQARGAQERADRRADRRAQREAAIEKATAHWQSLARRSAAGEAYLASRGLAGAIERGLVRFEFCGDVAVALHTGDGRIVNVVRRRLPEREPKAWGLAECPTAGTLLGALPDIVGRVDVVIVEGVADSLTAALAWPRAVVLGAHGAARMPMIAAAAATRVHRATGRLLLGCHRDEVGTRATIEAGRAAIGVGFTLDRDLVVVDHGVAKDLNDAWRAGWRP